MYGLQLAFSKLLVRFSSIFRDSPAWAEFTSASAGLIFCFLGAFGYLFQGKAGSYLSNWGDVDALFWLGIAINISVFQFFALLAQVRLLRSIAAFAMLTWHILIVFTAWPLVPWAPFFAFPLALCIPNFFAIARHAADWGR